MYDYDDYDDYDEQQDNKGGGRQIYSADDAQGYYAGSSNNARDEGSDYVQFVMESLGKIDVNAAGSRSVGSISEARVLEMLEAYNYDVEQTVDIL
jgi:hypothetical protein